MFNHVEGKLVEKNPTHAIIDCSGVGYLLNISLYTFSKIGDSEKCKILVHLSVKEDSLTLYGFADEDERKIFRQLISVSGIGENTARMMLSSMNPGEIRQAILTGNVGVLQTIKGIGNKTAQRVILDLRDKMGKQDPGMLLSGKSFSAPDKIKEQALSALLTLGFNRQNVEKVLGNILQSATKEISVEELIKAALNQL